MESQPQNPELRMDPENFHPCMWCKTKLATSTSSFEPTNEILVLLTLASSKGSYMPTHLRNLTWLPEPLLLKYSKYGSRGRLRPNLDPLAPLDTSAWVYNPLPHRGLLTLLQTEQTQIRQLL